MKSSHNLTPSDFNKIWLGPTLQRGELPFQFLDLTSVFGLLIFEVIKMCHFMTMDHAHKML